MKELTTLNDIAKRAGVAKSTVSRYLNNGSVSDKTREKIQAIIEETGYVPNQFAQSLKAQHSNMCKFWFYFALTSSAMLH